LVFDVVLDNLVIDVIVLELIIIFEGHIDEVDQIKEKKRSCDYD